MKASIAPSLKKYAKELGPYCPLNCGNLLVAAQYMLPLQIILKYLKAGSLILDWGCGSGHFSYLLMQENYDVNSFAYSEDDVLRTLKQKVKSHLNMEWKLSQSDGRNPVKLPYKDQTFDGVISLGVLEHVRETGGNERASLQEIYRILKPGGYFCCFHFPNRYSWIEAASRTLNKVKINKYYHSYLYTKNDILDLVNTSLFHLKEIGKYNLFPRRMLRLVPGKIAWNPASPFTYEIVERFFCLFFGAFSQNYYFVLQK